LEHDRRRPSPLASSIIPQKKNPVVAELAKGRTGRVFGALMQILTTTKGVTSGYNSDLQEEQALAVGLDRHG
jgi:argininosuccinate lyase